VELVFEPEPIPVEDGDKDIPEDLRNLSRADLALALSEARAEASSTRVLSEGIAALGATLAPKPAPEASLEKPPTLDLSDEEQREFDEKVFASGESPSKLMQKTLMGKVQKYVDYNLGLAANQFAVQEEQILESSSEEYREWKPEIEAFIATLPVNQRRSVGVRKYALEQVKLKNIDKIVQKRVEKALAEATAKPAVGTDGVPQRTKIMAPNQVGAGGAPQGSGRKKEYVDKNSELYKSVVAAAEAKGFGVGSPLHEEFVRTGVLKRLEAARKKA